MLKFYEQYMKGFHQEVYDELLTMGIDIYKNSIYEEAVLVAKEIMKRVRLNIEILFPRLNNIGYEFGEGFFDDFSSEEREIVEKDVPIFNSPSTESIQKISKLESMVGSLPISLKCWYENVGAVNFVGLFPFFEKNVSARYLGSKLDPIFVYSIDMVMKMIQDSVDTGLWANYHKLPIAPDNYYKYSLSGTGNYSVDVPCRCFDTILLLEQHQTTFINYLRICCKWGGFSGIENIDQIPVHIIQYLTDDLIPF